VQQLCWVCGRRLLRVRNSHEPKGTFVVGPMCVVNRVSGEPPSHADCAEWSARACPWLTKPAKDRRYTDLPEGVENPGGVMIERNPGVTALVESYKWSPMSDGQGGWVIRFDVHHVRWMAEGRNASADQVYTAIDTGLPALIEVCDGQQDLVQLASMTKRAMRWTPHVDILNYPTISTLLRNLP